MEYKTKYLEAMKKYDTLSANVHVCQSDGQLEAESFPEQEIAPEKSPITTPNEQDDSCYVPNAFLSEQVGAQSPSYQFQMRNTHLEQVHFLRLSRVVLMLF